MKFLILILVLVISAQPLQAGFCDMDMGKNQETSHHMDQMNHMDQMDQMDQMDRDSHDCCDSVDGNIQEGCDSGMNCGFCFASAPALPTMVKFNSAWVHQYSLDFSSGFILPSHSSTLLRPPIS